MACFIAPISTPSNFQASDSARVLLCTLLFCLMSQITIRSVVLAVLGRDHPKRGVAPRLATKLVSILFNFVMADYGLCELISPDKAIKDYPINGYSDGMQFFLSLSAGYFAWATVISVVEEK